MDDDLDDPKIGKRILLYIETPAFWLWLAEFLAMCVAFMDMNTRNALRCESRSKLWGMTYTTHPAVRGALMLAIFWILTIVRLVMRFNAHLSERPSMTVRRFGRTFLDDPANDPAVFRVAVMLFVTLLRVLTTLGWASLCPSTFTLMVACALMNIRLLEHFSYRGRPVARHDHE